ncbi:uncharacterized protein EI90DRAFT_3032765 [Cantharellus anzutake]|uniref:uncharacterized protein n=1 Tax=Cantharellus anzutake TaxID=1750568 RepID=UPI001902F31A|nr:uncharacterized protein EI90DRAFT_3032765 [Cantharellus anzutake]KAF8342285.1 hypothetical protein EI90DRAFT_3032765 [Cantharellus anzutake]
MIREKVTSEYIKFIKAPSMPLVKRILVLHVPGITPDILGMPPPPPHVQRKKVHPTSMFSGSAMIPAPSAQTSNSPAFPLPIHQSYPENKLPAMAKLFTHGLPTYFSGEKTNLEDAVEAFMAGPSYKTSDNQDVHPKRFTTVEKATLESLLLTPSQVLREGLLSPLNDPLDSTDVPMDQDISEECLEADVLHVANGWMSYPRTPVRTSAWVQPPSATADAGEEQVVLALDCEMVDTSSGKELVRLGVVDFWEDQPLLDLYVKPDSEVRDYLTEYTGVIAEMLESVTTTLADAQRQLLQLMRDSRCILIGHHIAHDLAALKLAHNRCIDTSVIYDNLAWPTRKASLKWLAQRYLWITIQDQRPILVGSGTAGQPSPASGPRGHSPIEDAQACVKLVKKKLENDMAFGKVVSTSIWDRVRMKGMKAAFVGPESQRYGSGSNSQLDCTNDDEIASGIIGALEHHEFVYGHLPNLPRALRWTYHATSSGDIPSFTSQPEGETALRSLNTAIDKLVAHLPHSTAVILYTGYSDPRHIGISHRKKRSWERKIRAGVNEAEIPESERWTNSDDEELQNLAEKVRVGLAFFATTSPAAQ